MYSRLRDGLFGPKQVINYLKDRWYKPLLQLLLFALIAIMPLVVKQITYDGLEYDERVAIREVFDNETINFKTVDGVMTATGSSTSYEKQFSEDISIALTSSDTYKGSATYTVVLGKNNIYISTMGMSVDICDYTAFPDLMNFDFSKLGNQNNTIEWDIVLNAVDQVVVQYNKKLIVPTAIMYFIEYMFYFAFTAAILSISFLTRFRRVIKYSAMYKLSIYYLAPYVLTTLLANILNIQLIVFIGFIISLVYSIIGANVIMKKLVNQERE